MSETKIEFLGEDDFLSCMNGENKVWRENHVKNGNFSTRDGIKLNYYKAENPNAKAAIVIVHGYCEFFGKYHEFAWYLWQAGYTVYFLEQRCHGYSQGKLAEADVIHIDSFKSYAQDLHEFMQKVVEKETSSLPLLLFANSMGGAVSSVFLEEYPDIFKAAILSSPMLKLKTGNMKAFMLKLVKLYMILTHKQKSLCPGQHHFNPKPDFANSSTLSEVRFNYLFNQRLEDSHYQTAGASLGWVMAAVDVSKIILKNADKIKIPIVLMQAGMDSLVEPEGFDAFMSKVPQAKKFFYENSKHEIFNAGSEVRKQYFKDVLEQFDKMLNLFSFGNHRDL
ncbi:MAG: lysophospholipase [Treponema sp.]|nr:lysophospholipase [Treponema sp.]